MTTTRRGTSNSNDRGSAEARRQRKKWLFETWSADCDLVTPRELEDLDQAILGEVLPSAFDERYLYVAELDMTSGLFRVNPGLGRPAVRCFRCGTLCHWDSVEIDRIKPGCEGGRYTKSNIRPACGSCNKVLCGEYVKRRNAKRAAANARRRELRKQRAAERDARVAGILAHASLPC